jgi:AraC-like DNA-binding protein
MPLVEKITFSRPADLPEVEILSGENNQRGWCVYHQTYTVCTMNTFTDNAGRVCHGSAEWVYRGRSQSSPGQSLMLMEPGEIHRNTKPPPPCNFEVVMIDPQFVDKIALETGMNSRPRLRRASTSDPALYRAFARFHAAMAEGSTYLHLQSLLAHSIGLLLAGHTEKSLRSPRRPSPTQLSRARDYIHQYHAERISLERLADIAGLSRFHFLRSFTEEFGLPPHAYQVKLRVEKARHLLKAGVPIKAIEVGFSDQSHLTRHFKKVHGVTPARYASMVGMA